MSILGPQCICYTYPQTDNMRRRQAKLGEKAMRKYVRRVGVNYGGMPTGSGGYRQEVACRRYLSKGGPASRG